MKKNIFSWTGTAKHLWFLLTKEKIHPKERELNTVRLFREQIRELNNLIKNSVDYSKRIDFSYTGNPDERQWCPKCLKLVYPEVNSFREDGWEIKCPNCQYLFDED